MTPIRFFFQRHFSQVKPNLAFQYRRSSSSEQLLEKSTDVFEEDHVSVASSILRPAVLLAFLSTLTMLLILNLIFSIVNHRANGANGACIGTFERGFDTDLSKFVSWLNWLSPC